MKATQLLHNLGQSIWLDNITRELLNTGTLKQYVADLSVTGLTSNPTIFDHAIKNSTAYDSAIREKLKQGKSGKALFFEWAWEDITRAADIFGPIHKALSCAWNLHTRTKDAPSRTNTGPMIFGVNVDYSDN
jgi:transaldolase